MKCKHCDGAGFYENGASQFKCVYCDGSGEVQMTEQEYIQTCNMEQLAEWIVHIADQCTISHECNRCESWCDEKKVMEWLKQPHCEVEK